MISSLLETISDGLPAMPVRVLRVTVTQVHRACWSNRMSRSLTVAGVSLYAARLLLRPILKRVITFRPASRLGQVIQNKVIQASRTHMNNGVRLNIQKAYVPANYGDMRQGHPHPDSAKERNASTIAISCMIKSMGFEPYIISPSKREEGSDGIRYMYCVADLDQDVKQTPLTDNHIIMGTDVDYYADLHALCSTGRPIILYTFNPTCAAGEVNEGYFTIKDNLVRYRVAGGKTVEHPIWDYSQDVVCTDVYHDSILCSLWRAFHRLMTGHTTPSVIVSNIDMWEVSKHRRIVAITPFARLPSVLASTLQGVKLTQMDYSMGHGYNGVVDYGAKVPTISLARAGELACANLPLILFQSLRVSHAQTKNKALSDTARRSELPWTSAPVLHDFLTKAAGEPPETYTPNMASHYTIVTPNATVSDVAEDGKTYARSYAPAPLGVDAVFPVLSTENAKAAIEGRVTKPQKVAKAASEVMAVYIEYASEFVDLIVAKEAGKGVPMTTDEVIERQSRPSQRLRSQARDMDQREPFRVSAFNKREAYNTASDPRIISSCPTMHTLELSSYTLAMKDNLLKTLPFYVPGATPTEIANRLQDLARAYPVLVETDFSRFDGHINEFLRRRVEFAVYLRYFRPEYRSALSKLLNAECNPKARLGDLRYEPGCSRLSGSPLTTDGNTLINAFAQYCIQRKNGHSVSQSYDQIGLICGDDAVVPECGITAESRTKITMKLGLPMKVARIARRGQPIGFLSRIFLDLWTTPDSIQSPLRALLKIHTTVDVVSDLMDAGIAKASGYRVTDDKTPIIGNWVRCYLKLADQTGDALPTRDVPYYSLEEFRDGPWPQGSVASFVDVVANDLGITTGEVADYCAALDSYEGEIDAMPQLSLPTQTAKLTAVVDGEIHQSGSSSDSNVDQSSNAETLTKPNSDGKPSTPNIVPPGASAVTSEPGKPGKDADGVQPGYGVSGDSKRGADLPNIPEAAKAYNPYAYANPVGDRSRDAPSGDARDGARDNRQGGAGTNGHDSDSRGSAASRGRGGMGSDRGRGGRKGKGGGGRKRTSNWGAGNGANRGGGGNRGKQSWGGDRGRGVSSGYTG